MLLVLLLLSNLKSYSFIFYFDKSYLVLLYKLFLFFYSVLFLCYGFYSSFISDHPFKILRSSLDCSLLEIVRLLTHPLVTVFS